MASICPADRRPPVLLPERQPVRQRRSEDRAEPVAERALGAPAAPADRHHRHRDDRAVLRAVPDRASAPRRGRFWRGSAFFAAIGLAFMLVEAGWISGSSCSSVIRRTRRRW